MVTSHIFKLHSNFFIQIHHELDMKVPDLQWVDATFGGAKVRHIQQKLLLQILGCALLLGW